MGQRQFHNQNYQDEGQKTPFNSLDKGFTQSNQSSILRSRTRQLLSSSDVLHLQRTIGNQAVIKILKHTRPMNNTSNSESYGRIQRHIPTGISGTRLGQSINHTNEKGDWYGSEFTHELDTMQDAPIQQSVEITEEVTIIKNELDGETGLIIPRGHINWGANSEGTITAGREIDDRIATVIDARSATKIPGQEADIQKLFWRIPGRTDWEEFEQVGITVSIDENKKVYTNVNGQTTSQNYRGEWPE